MNPLTINEAVQSFKILARKNKARNSLVVYCQIDGSLAKELTSIGATKVATNAYVLPSKLLGIKYKPTHQKGRYKVQVGFTVKGLAVYR